MTALDITKPIKTDKWILIQQEEEPREETISETGTSKCEKRYKVILGFGAVIGIGMLVYCLIQLVWSSYYTKKLQSNDTDSIYYFYRGKGSLYAVIGLQSQNDFINNDEQICENKTSQNEDAHFSYTHNYFNEKADVDEEFLKKIENEQIKSKLKNKSYENKIGSEQVASHRITEDGEKQILNYNFFSPNKDIGTNNAEVKVSKIHNLFTDYHYETDVKNMQNENSSMEEITNINFDVYSYIHILACMTVIMLSGWCVISLYRYKINAYIKL